MADAPTHDGKYAGDLWPPGYHDATHYWLDGEWHELPLSMEQNMRLMALEIERLRAREKDLTLEGLGLIGRIEQARDALAGTDASSLPRDYPLERMAQDRMTEVKRLRAALEIMSMMGGYTKLHPDETAPGVEQNTYSWGVSDGYKEMADIARAALEDK